MIGLDMGGKGKGERGIMDDSQAVSLRKGVDGRGSRFGAEQTVCSILDMLNLKSW